jgi:hypothetical protein
LQRRESKLAQGTTKFDVDVETNAKVMMVLKSTSKAFVQHVMRTWVLLGWALCYQAFVSSSNRCE